MAGKKAPQPRLEVTKESSTGRNLEFKDTQTGQVMNRPQTVRAIKDGKYPDYHVREVNGLPTPVSNPDGKESNNLK